MTAEMSRRDGDVESWDLFVCVVLVLMSIVSFQTHVSPRAGYLPTLVDLLGNSGYLYMGVKMDPSEVCLMSKF